MDPAPMDNPLSSKVLEAHLHHTREKVLLLEALRAEFGPRVVEVVARTVRDRTREQWRQVAAKAPGHTPQDLVALLWDPLRAKGFEFELESRPEGIQVHCTRCPIAALAQATGGSEWLFHLACGVDAALVEGFNPDLEFRRTRTLMEGDACCDHGYFVRP